LWTVTLTIPGPPFGDARTIDDAKSSFKAAWLTFKDRVGEEALAKVYADMNHANRRMSPKGQEAKSRHFTDGV
jgi:hypothetical protein